VPPAPLSAECRLVFRAANPRDAARDVARFVREPVDWRRATFIAEKELAVAALWHALEAGGATAVPPAAVAERLRRRALVSGFRMLRLSDRLRATVTAFAARGIPVMLVKGAALGAMSDPTFRDRPMSDIDLLVREADLARAGEALRATAWVEHPDASLPGRLAGHHHLAPFLDPEVPDLRIELHRALLPAGHAFRIDEDEQWARATRAPAPFEGALLPAPEDLLLHACVHFAWSHAMRFGGWRTVRTVGVLVDQGRIDWPRFTTLALRSGTRTSCYWTLRLARRLAGIPVPDATLAALGHPRPRLVASGLERFFISDIATGEWFPSPSLRLSRALWRHAIRPPAGSVGHSGQWETDPKWEPGGAAASPPEGRVARAVRHARGFRRWWDFATRTLLPFD
jgi:hypothetical protein